MVDLTVIMCVGLLALVVVRLMGGVILNMGEGKATDIHPYPPKGHGRKYEAVEVVTNIQWLRRFRVYADYYASIDELWVSAGIGYLDPHPNTEDLYATDLEARWGEGCWLVQVTYTNLDKIEPPMFKPQKG